jgi:transcriptional regulator of heat shock response
MYNLKNFHKILKYLEKLSYDYDLKYIFTFMDGGTKNSFKQKLGLQLNDTIPSLVIHYLDEGKIIKYNININNKEQFFNDKNIRKFLDDNLVINNNNEIKNENIKKNDEIVKILKVCKLLKNKYYDEILFNEYNKGDLLLFIIDEYSFNTKEINFVNKIKNILDIIEENGIDFYLEEIMWVSRYDLIQYKNDILMKENNNKYFKLLIII